MSVKVDWFDDPTQLIGAVRASQRETSRAPTIAGYEILRELGRGGQGSVYAATQLSTKRSVAIKVLAEGAWATRTRRRRFEREIDLIATLRHPNIVRLYDSGLTSDGYPYYVMDYVEGMCLDEMIGVAASASLDHADDVLDARPARRSAISLLAPRPIVRVMMRVADAVHYAHQRGIIHRDLKPSNIRIDGQIEPMVLDFGLAKLSTEVYGEPTSTMSQVGEFMGSLPWASPEQVEGVPEGIDIRTDVYSLGVILFQLLTGRFPYPMNEGFSNTVEHIRVTTPRAPSLLARDIDGDLDTIVLKCLAKSAGDRYQTAGALARDLEHWLANEPIEAKRDNAMYALRQSMRRYRHMWRLVAAVAVAALLVLAGVSTMLLEARLDSAALRAAGDRNMQLVTRILAATDGTRVTDVQANAVEALGDDLVSVASSLPEKLVSDLGSRIARRLRALEGPEAGARFERRLRAARMP